MSFDVLTSFLYDNLASCGNLLNQMAVGNAGSVFALRSPDVWGWVLQLNPGNLGRNVCYMYFNNFVFFKFLESDTVTWANRMLLYKKQRNFFASAILFNTDK